MVVVGLIGLIAAQHAWPGELEIISGPGNIGELQWRHLEVVYHAPATKGAAGRWHLLADGLIVDAMGDLGRIDIECSRGRLDASGASCETGKLNWAHGELDASWQSDFTLESGPGTYSLQLAGEGLDSSIHWATLEDKASFRVELEMLDVSRLPAGVLEAVGLREAGGQLDGQAVYEEGGIQGQLRLVEGEFDSVDGRLAAAGLDVELTFGLEWLNGDIAYWLELIQSGGEVLAGSVYLPPPAGELELAADGRFRESGAAAEASFILNDPGAMEMRGDLSLIRGDEAWALETLTIDVPEFDLPAGWERWADGPMAARGLGDLEPRGNVRGALTWHEGQLTRLTGEIENLQVVDPAERFRFDELAGSIRIDMGAIDIDLRWGGLGFYGLPLGPASAHIEGNEYHIRLSRPLRMPLLDGAVVIDRLVWHTGEQDARELTFDAHIEPVNLAALTHLLEFPEFGGVLSGRFPGVIYVDERLAFTGGIDIEAFSGRIQLSELAVERPFGSLPALAAQVELERLDLAEVTSAFNFGQMEGQLSGWMRDLRLLDWRPVAMDARFYTHDDAPRRRISQRAVENLSNLGGAPAGALVSGTVMRIFSEFPYRRAGLACRLSNNICHIDGVAPHESGGFYIVEGRLLPRLDIIGHRRLVDWPRLLAQLAAMLEEG